jgi:hypothetical protein
MSTETVPHESKLRRICWLERVPLSDTTPLHTSFYLMECESCKELTGFPEGNFKAAIEAGVWKPPRKIKGLRSVMIRVAGPHGEDEYQKSRPTEVDLFYTIELQTDGIMKGRKLFTLYGGTTGYEGFYLDYTKECTIDKAKLLSIAERGWHACMGDSRYPDLVIEGSEMKKAFEEAGLL